MPDHRPPLTILVAGLRRCGTGGHPAFDAILHPPARRLVARRGAVPRVGGPSAGTDAAGEPAGRHGRAALRRAQGVPGCRPGSTRP
jgi:hypothetical protein